MEWILNRHFWIVHLFLIGLFALALATVLSRMVESRIRVDPNRAEPLVRQSVEDRRTRRKPLSYYSVILDKNIFHAVVEKTPPKKGSSQKAQLDISQVRSLARTPLNVRLRGTAVREGGDSFAIIEDRSTQKEDLYHIGDMVLGQAKVMQIYRDRVVVLREGKKEVIELFANKEESKRRSRKAASPKHKPLILGKGIRRVGANRWSVSREAIESAKANMSELMTQIRIIPNFTEGRPDGFKLLSIKRGSLFDRLGLRNGDVIREINGVFLDSPQKAIEIYGELESGRTISVGISRGGREQILNYDLK
ncbi:MAG: hypothetical protein JRH07_03495 [Deltaproteobacteria bacterium]|nr:hypothetical protein [Deltaproteobacteria bacterium]MBW2120894.1 hypothetical protein [Deltaproteobacteria bacterium]